MPTWASSGAVVPAERPAVAALASDVASDARAGLPARERRMARRAVSHIVTSGIELRCRATQLEPDIVCSAHVLRRHSRPLPVRTGPGADRERPRLSHGTR